MTFTMTIQARKGLPYYDETRAPWTDLPTTIQTDNPARDWAAIKPLALADASKFFKRCKGKGAVRILLDGRDTGAGGTTYGVNPVELDRIITFADSHTNWERVIELTTQEAGQ